MQRKRELEPRLPLLQRERSGARLARSIKVKSSFASTTKGWMSSTKTRRSGSLETCQKLSVTTAVATATANAV